MISDDVIIVLFVNNNLQVKCQPETALIDGSVHSNHIRKNSKEGVVGSFGFKVR